MSVFRNVISKLYRLKQIIVYCSYVLSETDIVPADIIGRTTSTADPAAPSSTVVLKTKGQTSNMQAVVSTTRKSKASCTQTKQGDQKPSRAKHTCKVCDKVCRSPSVLKVHIRVHSAERPYMCKICDKPFSTKTQLAQHMRIHTGDKPYQCKVCDKCFPQSSQLTRHMRIHTGIKPYQCKVCDKCFSQSGTLTKHGHPYWQ